MQRAVHNISHGNNALVQEVKVSRLNTTSHKENISHLYPEKSSPAFEEKHHSEEKEHSNHKVYRKSKLNINKIFENKLNINKLFENKFSINKLFDIFKDDDFIILGIILLLVFEGTDDFILLIALGYLLLF